MRNIEENLSSYFLKKKSKLTFLSTLLPNDFPYYIDKKLKKEKKKKGFFFLYKKSTFYMEFI